ncbi:MAG: hypothetical protein M1828_001189 [Chrysothrix sp. TS-e1954]|nr:MAG: hypothetical protein M1828_001189 [Chrysothrix sp. TS-e1954]
MDSQGAKSAMSDDMQTVGKGPEYDSNKASGLKATIAREDRSEATKEKAQKELDSMGDVHYGDQKNPASESAKENLGKK